jgi:DHA1 family multidrug resistance protein-like MFS transporter
VIPVANLAVRASVPPERQGAAFGVAASVTSVAFGFGPLAGGFLASAYGFGAPFLAPGFLLFAASLTLVVPAVATVLKGRPVKRIVKTALSWIVSL